MSILQKPATDEVLLPVERLLQAGEIEISDFRFAEYLVKMGETNSQLLVLAAQCSQLLKHGSICLDASEYFEQIKEAISVTVGYQWDDKENHLPATPLVLDKKNLYLQRYWLAEQKLATHINQLIGNNTPDKPDEKLELEGLAEKQQQAVRFACDYPFSIVTGGPGTGKTTVVASIIKNLQRTQSLQVRLAAPTGKAAMRLQQSLDEQLPSQALRVNTLHYLLGSRNNHPGQYRYNASNKLPLDILIIDECSMMDLPLMLAVIEALPENAKLVLIGDAQQLPPIGPGSIFADICQRAQSSTSLLANCFTRLEKSWRFAEHPEIGMLAGAILEGDEKVCRGFENTGKDVKAFLLDTAGFYQQQVDNMVEPYIKLLSQAIKSGEHQDYQKILEDYQLLTTVRDARLGVSGLNRAVEQKLKQQGLLQGSTLYPGLKLMILQNHVGLGLYNGDTGVVIPAEDGGLKVGFVAAGRWRFFKPSQLPAWEPCFAMTVHKAQGSEYQHVAIVLPEQLSEKQQSLLSVELLYTAATRAKALVNLFYTPESLKLALGKRVKRYSQLGSLID